MKKIEYILVEGFIKKKFNEDVNRQLEDGWKLYGHSLAIYHPEFGIHRSQAFIKGDVKVMEPTYEIETTDKEDKFIPWDKPLKTDYIPRKKPLKADFTPWEKEDIDYTKVGLKSYECKECFIIVKCNHHPIKPCENCNSTSWRKEDGE